MIQIQSCLVKKAVRLDVFLHAESEKLEIDFVIL